LGETFDLTGLPDLLLNICHAICQIQIIS
jgi:hypothetical protein